MNNILNTYNELIDLQNTLTGALIGLSKTCIVHKKTDKTDSIIIESLQNSDSFNKDILNILINKVNSEKNAIAPNCSTCLSKCGNTDNFDMSKLYNEDDNTHALKILILYSARSIATKLYQAMAFGITDNYIIEFLYKSLGIISEQLTADALNDILIQASNIALLCEKIYK